MSLVVAIKKGGVVHLGADTRVSKGDRVRSILAEEDYKIQRLGSCFVGSAGAVSNIQIMTENPEWFELGGKPLTKKYIVKNIIPRYYDQVKKTGKLEIDEENRNLPNSCCDFIVTDGNSIFVIDDDFEVIEKSKYAQIGCASMTAFTYLVNATDAKSPNEIILSALRTSAYRDDGVGAPYVLINTKDNEYEIVEE